MSTLGKVCVILCVFGALNWVGFRMFDKDVVRLLDVSPRRVGMDFLYILTAMSAIYVLLDGLKSGKK